ncbi:MAG: LUD domain-containing protein [Fidelibacterota bacterium]|nr:MAG: LUD domain-containing protein [Candidatus Neomarinimicrobiota bacterium]
MHSGSESLIREFVAAIGLTGATVELVSRSPEALKHAVRRVLSGGIEVPSESSGSALLAEPDDLPSELWDPLRNLEQVVDNPPDNQLRSARVGITDAFAGVARTGSVCVAVTAKLGGAVSLFPRSHIAVLEARNIVSRPGDVFTAGQLENKGMKRSFVFITGPSVTADMGELVRGVHGPDHLHIIILEE